LPDFDYHMRPSEMRQPSSGDPEAVSAYPLGQPVPAYKAGQPVRLPDRARRPAGVQAAASRIAAVPIASSYAARQHAKPGSGAAAKPPAGYAGGLHAKRGSDPRSHNGHTRLTATPPPAKTDGHRPVAAPARAAKSSGRQLRVASRGARQPVARRRAARVVSKKAKVRR